jgi:hypothetical protein
MSNYLRKNVAWISMEIGIEGSGNGELLLMGKELHFWKINSEEGFRLWLHDNVNVLNSLELYTYNGENKFCFIYI